MTTQSSSYSPPARTVLGLQPAIVFVLCYFVFQAIFVTWISNGAGLDDAEQLGNVGFLDWGYGGSQPPLYTWFVNFAVAGLGTSLLTLQIVKFGILASLFLSVYAGIRLLELPRSVAAAGMLGLFLIPQIGWESQRALTHSIAGTAACGWAFLAFVWYMRKRNALSAILLGIAMAAAVLGKFNAAFFVGTLIITGLSMSEFRKTILSRLSIFTLAAFVLCLTPTTLWMLQHKSNVVARSGKLQIGVSGDMIMDRITGAGSLIQAAFLFSILAIAVAGIIAAVEFKTRNKNPAPTSYGERFIYRLVLTGLLIVLIGVIAIGATNVKDRWLQPVLFLTPAAMACLLARYRTHGRSLASYAIVSAILALCVPPILAYNLTIGSSNPPYGQLEYRTLYNEIRAHGEFSTILAENAQIPGNFRLFDPSLKVVHPETPDATARIKRPLLVMWFGDGAPPERLQTLLDSAGQQLPIDEISSTQMAYRTKPELKLPVRYIILP